MVLRNQALTLILLGILIPALPSIVHAQATVTLTVPDGAAAEAGQDSASFTVTRSTDAGTGASLRVYLQLGGSAARVTDYSTGNLNAAGGTTFYVIIPVAQTSVTVTVTPQLDNLIEGDETVTLDVLPWQLEGNEYIIGTPSSGMVTIADDVAQVHLTVDDDEAAEFGQDPAGFTITRDSHGDTTVSLRVYVQLGGTAVRGTDYATSGLNLISGTTHYVIIQPNQASASITFTPTTDNLIEGEETITYNLLGPGLAGHDYTIGVPNSGGATISDDVAEVHLTVDDDEAAEFGQDPAGFTVTRDGHGETTTALRVYLQVDGSAERVTDYLGSGLSLVSGTTYFTTIQAHQLAVTITLTPVLDNLQEGEETITFSLLGPGLSGHDYTVGAPDSGSATLSDDVAEVHLTVDDDQAAEAGQNPAGFTITRDGHGNMATTLRVYLELTGTAVRVTDYTTTGLGFASGTTYFATIPVSQSSVSITFTPVRDNRLEGEETISFSLLGPALAGHDYTIGAPSSGGAVISDDIAEVTITAADAEGAELGAEPASFSVARSDQGDTGDALRVYLQLGGTASINTDYINNDVSLASGTTYFTTIPANELVRIIDITPKFDLNEEGDETVSFTILAPQLAGHDYVIGAPEQAMITLLNHVEGIFDDGFEDLDP